MADRRSGDALPVLDVIHDVERALLERGAAVLIAPPGTGKTTAVPPALLDQPWAASGRLVVVEPRRLAARAAATRMARVAGEKVGGTFGYSVRGERKRSSATRVEVVTEGLFLRRLQRDPELSGVSAVLLDEFHERSIDADLCLALLLDVRSSIREDLRLLVMSATLDPDPITAILGGDRPVPSIRATAPLFPVETRYRPGSAHDPLEDRVADAVGEALRDESGDVLVFLPGRPEIRRTARVLEQRRTAAEVLQLHGSLSPGEQQHVVDPDDGASSGPTVADRRRRVILSTSLAESSITVPGVRVVVDAGRRRSVRTDPHTGLPKLTTSAASAASADQRRGRSAREAPGVTYRLWSRSDERHRPAADPPEITDGDLAPLTLAVLEWGVDDPTELQWVDEPPTAGIERAQALLAGIGAVDAGRLTTLGREVADVGFHPRLGAVAVAARRAGHVEVAAAVLAVLETSRSGDVDLAERVRELRHGRAGGDALHALRLWRRALGVDRSDRAVEDAPLDDAPLDDVIARMLLAGYGDRVARRRATERTDDRGRDVTVFQLRSGGEVAVSPGEPQIAGAEWLVVVDLDGGDRARAGRLHLGAVVSEASLLETLSDQIRTIDSVEWDRRTGDVVAERRRELGAITIAASPLSSPPRDAVQAALLAGIEREGLAALDGLDAAASLRARVAWLRDHGVPAPDGADWPDWSDAELLASLDQWLVPFLGRARRRRDLDRIDVRQALSSQLTWEQRRGLDRLAPTHLDWSSGRRSALHYGALDGEPATVVTSLRLRDALGTDVHPTVGAGDPVTVELLSPAGRPLQRTTDLPGFWRGSYAQVRSEMRGRYPKHPWPERPWEPAR